MKRQKSLSPPFMILAFSLLFLSFFSFTSAFTWNSDIDDLCIIKEYQYWDINLTEHADFNMDDVCYLYAKDPWYNGTSGHYHQLPANHMTLNLDCYEVAYYFEEGHDWLRFETLDDNCYLGDSAPLAGDGFRFWCCEHGDCGDKGYGNTFGLNVSDNCPGSWPSGGGGGSGSSCSDALVFHLSLNETSGSTAYDRTGNYNGTKQGSPVLGAPGNLSTAWYFDDTAEYITLNAVNLTNNGGAFTVNLFYNITSKVANGFVSIGDGIGSYEGVDLRYTSTNKYRVHYESNTQWDVSSSFTLDTWYMITLVVNSTHFILYENGQELSKSGITEVILDDELNVTIGYAGNQYANGATIDEVSLYDDALNATEIEMLFNASGVCNGTVGGGGGGSGTAPVKNASIPDIYLDGSSSNVTDLTQYFWNYTTIILQAEDPITNFTYFLYPGYATVQGDYFELWNNNTNFTVESYERPYNFTVNVSACNGLSDQWCVEDSVDVFIQTNLSGVLLINPFSFSDTITYPSYSLYSTNYYFQYQDSVVVVVPDSNFTGILNSTFPFTYVQNTSHSECSDYLIYYNCTYGTSYNYVSLADINVTVDCQEFNANFLFTPYNEYNETVLFNASNAVNSTWGQTYISAGASGNPNNLCPGQAFPYLPGNVTDNSSYFENLTSSISGLYPEYSSVPERTRWIIVLITLFTVFFGGFAILFPLRVSISAIINIAYIVTIPLVFMFYSISYITFGWALTYSAFFFAFHLIKFFKGGS